MLEKLAAGNSEATDVYLRLMELGKERQDWQAVAVNANRMLAVNPLVPAPHRFRAEAAEQLGDSQAAAESYHALLELDPADPALLHFRLAHHLHLLKRPEEARRQVLMALEEAPRYRDAHRLLLTIVQADSAGHQAVDSEQEEPDNDSVEAKAKPPAGAPATKEQQKEDDE